MNNKYIFTLNMVAKQIIDENEALKGIISRNLLQIADHESYILQLEERIKLLQNVIFCLKSERYNLNPQATTVVTTVIQHILLDNILLF